MQPLDWKSEILFSTPFENEQDALAQEKGRKETSKSTKKKSEADVNYSRCYIYYVLFYLVFQMSRV